jgi:hypothetical protein
MSSSHQKATSNFTEADVRNMLSIVRDFFTESSRLNNAYKNEPTSDSIAAHERIVFQNRESVESAHYGGFLSMEIAADHLMAFTDTLTEPANTIAPWTCVRGLLESCSLACWFLNPIIDVKTRVGRYFAFRYIGFVQQIKLYKVGNKGQAEDVKRVEERIQKVESDALKLGYPRVVNKVGEMDGIGQKMPDITSLIGMTLDREAEYRLLSAIAHGHHWVTPQIGFRVIEFTDSDSNIRKGLKKTLEPMFVLYAASIAVTSFAQVLWYAWQLYGWNKEEIGALLDTTYNRLNYTEKRRLWRS